MASTPDNASAHAAYAIQQPFLPSQHSRFTDQEILLSEWLNISPSNNAIAQSLSPFAQPNLGLPNYSSQPTLTPTSSAPYSGLYSDFSPSTPQTNMFMQDNLLSMPQMPMNGGMQLGTSLSQSQPMDTTHSPQSMNINMPLHMPISGPSFSYTNTNNYWDTSSCLPTTSGYRLPRNPGVPSPYLSSSMDFISPSQQSQHSPIGSFSNSNGSSSQQHLSAAMAFSPPIPELRFPQQPVTPEVFNFMSTGTPMHPPSLSPLARFPSLGDGLLSPGSATSSSDHSQAQIQSRSHTNNPFNSPTHNGIGDEREKYGAANGTSTNVNHSRFLTVPSFANGMRSAQHDGRVSTPVGQTHNGGDPSRNHERFLALASFSERLKAQGLNGSGQSINPMSRALKNGSDPMLMPVDAVEPKALSKQPPPQPMNGVRKEDTASLSLQIQNGHSNGHVNGNGKTHLKVPDNEDGTAELSSLSSAEDNDDTYSATADADADADASSSAGGALASSSTTETYGRPPKRFKPSTLRVNLTPSCTDSFIAKNVRIFEEDGHRYRTRSKLRSLRAEIEASERDEDLGVIRKMLRMGEGVKRGGGRSGGGVKEGQGQNYGQNQSVQQSGTGMGTGASTPDVPVVASPTPAKSRSTTTATSAPTSAPPAPPPSLPAITTPTRARSGVPPLESPTDTPRALAGRLRPRTTRASLNGNTPAPVSPTQPRVQARPQTRQTVSSPVRATTSASSVRTGAGAGAGGAVGASASSFKRELRARPARASLAPRRVVAPSKTSPRKAISSGPAINPNVNTKKPTAKSTSTSISASASTSASTLTSASAASTSRPAPPTHQHPPSPRPPSEASSSSLSSAEDSSASDSDSDSENTHSNSNSTSNTSNITSNTNPTSATSNTTNISSTSTSAAPPVIDIPIRSFPSSIPINAEFPLFYRKMPICTFVDPSATDCPSPSRPAPNAATFNAPRNAFDLYTPRFVKGIGREKVGLCPICYEAKAHGGASRTEWLSMKFSAYKCYHMQYAHGISPTTALPFSPPIAFRTARRSVQGNKNEKDALQEGKCHKCQGWHPVEGIKRVESKLKEIYWWKHAAACHKGSTIAGESGIFIEDDYYDAISNMPDEGESD